MPSSYDVTLHDKETKISDGQVFAPSDTNYRLTFEIIGSSSSRTIAFEKAGPSGVYLPCMAFNEADPTKYGSQTVNGNDKTPESWQVEVPAGYSFRARIVEVSGGYVTIKGKAVG